MRKNSNSKTTTARKGLKTSILYQVRTINAHPRHFERNKVKSICIGGAGGKINPAEIKVGDLNRTKNDPLLAKVRSQLRAYHGFSRNPQRTYSLECVYSTEQARFPDGKGSTTFKKPGESIGMDCSSGFGAVTHITATFAFYATARLIDKLLKHAD